LGARITLEAGQCLIERGEFVKFADAVEDRTADLLDEIP
jgi:hypothetical protein